jgi:acyl-coenzyme A synthetase/AMP-(fatty) acid ligase
MLELPGIRDVAAVNAPRFRQPDRIQVFVQLETRDGQPPRWTAESLQEKLDGMFPPYLRPAMITFVDHIPYDDEERKLRKELKFKYRNTEPWRSN